MRIRTRKNLLILLSATSLISLSFTASCATTQKKPAVVNPDLTPAVVNPDPTLAAVNPDPTRVRTPEKQPQANNVEQRLLEEYRRWKGTRHQLGGAGSRGIDCSGFVKVVYKDVFHIDLPRTTKDQVRQGKFIPFRELQPGDLIFFKPPDYPRHVGIFLSRSQFVHASKTKGVTISKIDDHYWGKYYWTARRIIPVHNNQ